MDFLIVLILTPFLIVAGAYFAIGMAKVKNEKWYLLGNSLFAYGTAAAFANVLLFLVLFGSLLWNILFEINGYVAAVGGLIVLIGALGVLSIAIYSQLGAVALFIHRMKK